MRPCRPQAIRVRVLFKLPALQDNYSRWSVNNFPRAREPRTAATDHDAISLYHMINIAIAPSACRWRTRHERFMVLMPFNSGVVSRASR